MIPLSSLDQQEKKAGAHTYVYPASNASINYKKTHTMCFLKEMDGVRGWEIVNTKLKLNLIISKILK
jgi:hypothetical protein